MLIRWPIWVAAAVVGCGLAPVAVFAHYGHHATTADLANPVTLPVELTRQIIGSGDAFDRDTAILVDQQSELGARLVALRQLAADLDTLDTASATLGDLTATLGAGAAQTGDHASTPQAPLAALTDRANQSTGATGTLAASTAALAAQTPGRVGRPGRPALAIAITTSSLP